MSRTQTNKTSKKLVINHRHTVFAESRGYCAPSYEREYRVSFLIMMIINGHSAYTIETFIDIHSAKNRERQLNFLIVSWKVSRNKQNKIPEKKDDVKLKRENWKHFSIVDMWNMNSIKFEDIFKYSVTQLKHFRIGSRKLWEIFVKRKIPLTKYLVLFQFSRNRAFLNIEFWNPTRIMKWRNNISIEFFSKITVTYFLSSLRYKPKLCVFECLFIEYMVFSEIRKWMRNLILDHENDHELLKALRV